MFPNILSLSQRGGHLPLAHQRARPFPLSTFYGGIFEGAWALSVLPVAAVVEGIAMMTVAGCTVDDGVRGGG